MAHYRVMRNAFRESAPNRLPATAAIRTPLGTVAKPGEAGAKRTTILSHTLHDRSGEIEQIFFSSYVFAEKLSRAANWVFHPQKGVNTSADFSMLSSYPRFGEQKKCKKSVSPLLTKSTVYQAISVSMPNVRIRFFLKKCVCLLTNLNNLLLWQ